jgi:hypothetical protein
MFPGIVDGTSFLIIRNGANTMCIQFRMISYSESFKIRWNYENWSWEKWKMRSI